MRSRSARMACVRATVVTTVTPARNGEDPAELVLSIAWDCFYNVNA